MKSLKNDIVLGLIYAAGLYGFISGEFIVSTVLFASAAIYSNIELTRLLSK